MFLLKYKTSSYLIYEMNKNIIKTFYTSAKNCVKVTSSNLRNSHEWLSRQQTDPYVEKAKILNYRCRSAFKLIEIDDRFKILQPGITVIDCGAAPGSWSQVAANRTNSDQMNNSPIGQVISVDLSRIHPIKGVTIFDGLDFTLPKTQERIKNALGGKFVDCVLSDMAPKATGVKVLDQENIIELCYSVLKFSLIVSAKNSTLLVKVFDSGYIQKFEKDMEKFYENVKRVKPTSSRQDSSELFLLGRGFRNR